MAFNKWAYGGFTVNSVEDMPDGVYGFIYLIRNHTTGRFYIGQKQLYSVTNPVISKKKYYKLKAAGVEVARTKNTCKSKNGKPAWIYRRKQVKKETNWKTYTGSNEELNGHIKRGDSISKEILRYTFSKREHTFREVEEQVRHQCLDRCDCYNRTILGRFFMFKDCE